MRIFRIRPERYAPPRWLAWDGSVFLEGSLWGGGLIKRRCSLTNADVAMGEYVPGAKFKVAYDTNPRGYFDSENGVVMTVNSLGLRGGEASADKPAGTYRILGIGDSFAFGEGVKDKDTFLNRLQLQLNARPAGNERHQVLNAGVQGYNTRDEVLYLEHRWLALNPDLVLIIFYLNDAYDDRAILNRGQELGIYSERSGGLAQHSYLADFVQHAYDAHRQSKAVEAYYKQHYFTDAEHFLETPGSYDVDWTVSRAALEHAADLCRQRNIKLGLIIFPELYNLNGGYPFLGIHKLVSDYCHRLDIPCLDLLDTFRGHGPETLWVHPSDHHPNETAHALAATAIESFVRREFLNPIGPAKSDPRPP